MHLLPLLFAVVLGSTLSLPVPVEIKLWSETYQSKDPKMFLKPSDSYLKIAYTAEISQKAPVKFDVVTTHADNAKFHRFINAWIKLDQSKDKIIKDAKLVVDQYEEKMEKASEIMQQHRQHLAEKDAMIEEQSKVIAGLAIGIAVVMLLVICVCTCSFRRDS